MWGLVRQRLTANIRFIRPYSLGQLTPSELRFKEKLDAEERERQKNAPEWEKRDLSLRKRYGQWNPTRKLSRQQMNDIRDLKARAPELKTVQIADFFNINPESIRRILKSKWAPSEEERAQQEARGIKRKKESLQRRLEAQEKNKINVAGVTGKGVNVPLPIIKKNTLAGPPKHYKQKYQKYGASLRGQDQDSQRRSRKPFTQDRKSVV